MKYAFKKKRSNRHKKTYNLQLIKNKEDNKINYKK